ncbi:uncharacterized protein EI90DRAFT_2935459 [Cantharellus anzutake]|uniref:uncharacterized protein n=1 Tax=Cantharellus anzutake TaxID=1750568 RepID=UPI001904DD9C|nr:uncharacterized protein EI90DRAFT_2935459 [Cantharellus anzutake]KAF8323619.1 hypothetical protein EI90DRAFT_2935459 [Cantharellus anzutake]
MEQYIKFSSIYYQFSVQRLPACPLTVHALLHIPYNIRNNGPPCNNWTFIMEHWCGSLLPSIKSQKQPFICLTLRQYHTAQLFEVVNHYNVTQLMPLRHDMNVPSWHEKLFLKSACALSYLFFLRRAVEQKHIPDMTIQKKIAKHMKTSFGGSIGAWLDILPQIMEHWAKVHIGNGGDLIQGSIAQMSSKQGLHNASFVHYELNTDSNAHCPQAKEDFVRTIYYGHLEYILQCTLPPNPISKNTKPETVLLGILTTCNTQQCDATLRLTYFKTMMLYIEIVDLAAICTVIGRIQTGTTDPWWAIVDQSGSWAHTVFTDDLLTADAVQQVDL